MENSNVPIYVLDYKNKTLALVIELQSDLDFYFEFEFKFDDIVLNLFYKNFIRLLTGEESTGLIKSDFQPILSNDYNTIICTFIKKYKHSVKTVVIGFDEEKNKYYNQKINSDKYMRNLSVSKKLDTFITKDKKSKMYFWGMNNFADITNKQYYEEVNKDFVWGKTDFYK